MKKSILTTLLLCSSVSVFAQTDVLKITHENGQQTTIAIADIKEMTFDTETSNPAQQYAGFYRGTQSVNVGGMYVYTAEITYQLIAENNGMLTVVIPEYALSGTVMGDLTLGTLRIEGLQFDETKSGFYRLYANDGLTQHFKAVNDGTTTMENDYTLSGESNILVKLTEKGIHIENPFKLGAMPLPMTATFDGTKE